MENSFKEAVIEQIKKSFARYKEWIKPTPGDPLVLTIFKSFFKALSAIVLVAFSPIVLLILILAFLAAL